jgi:hypothetical protein
MKKLTKGVRNFPYFEMGRLLELALVWQCGRELVGRCFCGNIMGWWGSLQEFAPLHPEKQETPPWDPPILLPQKITISSSLFPIHLLKISLSIHPNLQLFTGIHPPSKLQGTHLRRVSQCVAPPWPPAAGPGTHCPRVDRRRRFRTLLRTKTSHRNLRRARATAELGIELLIDGWVCSGGDGEEVWRSGEDRGQQPLTAQRQLCARPGDGLARRGVTWRARRGLGERYRDMGVGVDDTVARGGRRSPVEEVSFARS